VMFMRRRVSVDVVMRHVLSVLRYVSRGGEMAAGEIASQFDATQQAVSHHLQVLARARLFSERRDGARRLYALDPQALDPVREMLSELWPPTRIGVRSAAPASGRRRDGPQQS